MINISWLYVADKAYLLKFKYSWMIQNKDTSQYDGEQGLVT